jgi:hypothetical protein
MAKFVVQNPVVTLAGGTVSANVAQITLSVESDDVETTSFGSGGFRERIGGLKGGSVSLDLHQDFAAGAIDSIIWPLIGGTAAVTSALVRLPQVLPTPSTQRRFWSPSTARSTQPLATWRRSLSPGRPLAQSPAALALNPT